MKPTIQTRPRIGDLPKRRKKKIPAPETELRIEWLEWLIAEFGPEQASEWQEPPVSFREWKLSRELKAHEAA
ncbi:MAG: hypothetical protein ACYTGZ_10235 [Planctomycetota bacterium]|jgi:hypothetical protein